MKFTKLLENTLQQLDEMAVASLEGTVEAFGDLYSFETTSQQGTFTTTVRNQRGTTGEIIFSNPDRLVYFVDDKDNQKKIERMTGSKPSASRLKSYYVPELINRVSSNELF